MTIENYLLPPHSDGDFDVVVIGAGPVGLVLTGLLAAKGVRTALVDPNRLACPHPRATHIDDETMRLLQTLGVDDEKNFLRMLGHSVLGADGTKLVEFKMSEGRSDQGWFSDYQFHQPDFESRLRGRLSTRPEVALWLGWKATAVTQDTDAATVTAQDQSTGRTHELRAQYVVGADGANSFLRQLMAPEVEDLRGTHRSLIIDVHPFEAPAGLDPAEGFMMSRAELPVTYVPIGPPRLRFEFMLRAGQDAHEFERPANVYRMLSPWLAPGSYRIMRTDTYEWHSRLVRGWRDGRLFLAGDAAHTMPPMLGQGMCSGLRDAANLAWKLAGVVSGHALGELLDTYEAERSAHVRPFIVESARMANMIETFELVEDHPVVTEPQEQPQFRPPLGPGLLPENVADAAVLAPQPAADDGRRFDDLAGYRFALYSTAGFVAGVDEETRQLWSELDIAVVTEPSTELSEWMSARGAGALLVRPDRYTYAVAADRDALRTATLNLRDHARGTGVTG